MAVHNYKPWIEKYRPDNFDDIILDTHNRTILTNMITQDNVQHMLFYGPPGTGKTTTIVNLIKKYQSFHNQEGSDLIIHLNASDERGIDVIRNQILLFSNATSLFNKGKKFVILDEIDYMTKSAQQALKTIILECDSNICFCLICNYISRIEKSLQYLCIHFHFSSLSEAYILSFLQSVAYSENIAISIDNLLKIIRFFNSDIRSMINYLQINQYTLRDLSIIDTYKYVSLINSIEKKTIPYIIKQIQTLSTKHNVSKKEILKQLCVAIQNKILNATTNNNVLTKAQRDLIMTIKYVLHDKYNQTDTLLHYLVSKIKTSLFNSVSK